MFVHSCNYIGVSLPTVLLRLKVRTESVDLSADATLMVDISDALSERDRVKFTVHTKVCLSFSISLTVMFTQGLGPVNINPSFFLFARQLYQTSRKVIFR